MNYKHLYFNYTFTNELDAYFKKISKELIKKGYYKKVSIHKDIFNRDFKVKEYYFIKDKLLFYFELHTSDNYFKCDFIDYKNNITYLDFNIAEVLESV